MHECEWTIKAQPVANLSQGAVVTFLELHLLQELREHPRVLQLWALLGQCHLHTAEPERNTNAHASEHRSLNNVYPYRTGDTYFISTSFRRAGSSWVWRCLWLLRWSTSCLRFCSSRRLASSSCSSWQLSCSATLTDSGSPARDACLMDSSTASNHASRLARDCSIRTTCQCQTAQLSIKHSCCGLSVTADILWDAQMWPWTIKLVLSRWGISVAKPKIHCMGQNNRFFFYAQNH